jgi:hypothetical protein
LARLHYYSLGLALDFLRAFWRLSPRLGVREMAYWTNCGVRLARADAELTAEFFNSGSDVMLRVPPPVRARLFAINTGLAHLYYIDKVRGVLAAHIHTDHPRVTDTIRACLDLYQYLDPEPPSNSMPWQDPHTRPEREEKGEQPQPRRGRPNRDVGDQPATGEPEAQPDEEDTTAESGMQFEPGFRTRAFTVGEGDALKDVRESDVFYYDEWDHRIGDYRTRWCRVIEHDWESGDLIFANRTRAAYRGVLSQVRYQFQLLRPAGLRRVRGQPDGDGQRPGRFYLQHGGRIPVGHLARVGDAVRDRNVALRGGDHRKHKPGCGGTR